MIFNIPLTNKSTAVWLSLDLKRTWKERWMNWMTASQTEEGSNSSQSVGVHQDPKVAAEVEGEIVREAEAEAGAPPEVGAEDPTAGLVL